MPRQLYAPFILKCSAATCLQCSLADLTSASSIKYTCCGRFGVFFSVFVVVGTHFSDYCLASFNEFHLTDLLDF